MSRSFRFLYEKKKKEWETGAYVNGWPNEEHFFSLSFVYTLRNKFQMQINETPIDEYGYS